MYEPYAEAGFSVDIEGATRAINSDAGNRDEVDEIVATNVPVRAPRRRTARPRGVLKGGVLDCLSGRQPDSLGGDHRGLAFALPADDARMTDLDIDLVLVSVDGSEESHEAVDYAIAVAAEYDASVHALYVLDEDVVRAIDHGVVDEGDVADDTEAFTDSVVRRAEAAGIAHSNSIAYGFSTKVKTVHPAASSSTPPPRRSRTSSSSSARARLRRPRRGAREGRRVRPPVRQPARAVRVMVGDLPFLPAGTTLPPAPYLLVVLLATGGVVAALRRRRPRVTGRRVLALAPWMALGSAAHVLYVVDALPPLLSPFAGSPTVYLTVGSLAGAAWLVADATPDPGAGGPRGRRHAPPRPGRRGRGLDRALRRGARWSTIALVLTIPIAGAVWVGLTRLRPETAITGGVGALAVFAHALDGVSTAVGTTHLGFGERTPVSRILLEIGGLPSLPVVGEGWLFLLVKLAVASAVVWLFAGYIRETPGEGYLLLGFVAAVGLGPAAHNLLFAVAA